MPFEISNTILVLNKYISAIDDRVASCLIRRSIARQVQEQSLDLFDVTHTSQRSHTICFIDAERRGTHLCVKETGRDNVDSSKISPLSRQTLSEMVDRSLRRVVDLDLSESCTSVLNLHKLTG